MSSADILILENTFDTFSGENYKKNRKAEKGDNAKEKRK
jgi:hypothetical protein